MESSKLLGQKHATSMLLFLLYKGSVKQNEFLEVIPSNMTIDKLGKYMENEGLISIKREFAGRKAYTYSLTDKGRSVAEQLKNAELAASGHLKKSFFSRQQQVLTFLGNVGKATPSELNTEVPGSYDDLEELSKLKLVLEVIEEAGGKAMKFFTLTEKGAIISKRLKEDEKIVKG